MATTRLFSLHVNKGKTIAQTITDRTEYASNPEKTDKGELVTGYGCDARTADAEFLLSKEQYRHITGRTSVSFGKDVLAYHIRQSFKPGEITPEKANEMGRELALRFTKGNHAFIVATHIDKSHIHNHIIFNSTCLECDRKFRDFLGSAKVIRRISDYICIENGLSIVDNPKPSKGKNYHKWLGDKRKPSFTEQLRQAVDVALSKQPASFEGFLKLMEQASIEVKQTTAHVKFKLPEQKRPTRCDTLKGDYTVAAIKERIEGKRIVSVKQPATIQSEPPKLNLLIDIQNSIKAKDSPGYERWAKVFNLKQAAQTLIMLQENKITEYAMLSEKAEQAASRFNDIGIDIRKLDARLSEISNLQKHIGIYGKTKDVYAAYKKSKYSRKYYTRHEQEIEKHKEAKKAFDTLELKKLPSIKSLRQEYATVQAEKKILYSQYHRAKAEMQQLITAKTNVDRLLQYDRPEQKQKDGQEK